MLSDFNKNLGNMYASKPDYDSAYIYLEKALEFAHAAKDNKQQAVVYASIAQLYERQTKHQLALEYYSKSLALQESEGETPLYVDVLVSIGSLYHRIGNISQSRKVLERSIAIADRLNMPELKVGAYYILSIIVKDDGDIEKALQYQQEVIDVSRSINDKVFEIAGNDAMAGTYLYSIKDYDKALMYANKCLSLAKEYGEPMILAGIWKLLSNVYREQRNYRSSREAALNSWEIDSTDLDIGANLAYNIAFSSAFLGDEDQAAYFTRKYNEISA